MTICITIEHRRGKRESSLKIKIANSGTATMCLRTKVRERDKSRSKLALKLVGKRSKNLRERKPIRSSDS